MAASMSAAGREPQKQLLSIIRDFAAEKSHGERTVSGLKRRLDDVLAATYAATDELEAAKRAREVAETELRGRQVQASIVAASIQALEASISHLQEEVSKVSSDLDVLKTKGDNKRDEFLSQMHELNAKIRQFQQVASIESGEKCSELPPADGHHVSDTNETIDSEGILEDLVAKVSNIDAAVCILETEYRTDLLNHEKLCQELADAQAKRSVMEAVMGETKQLQELGGYPFAPAIVFLQFGNTFVHAYSNIWCNLMNGWFHFLHACPRKLSLTQNKQVAELEKVHASLAEELQRRYACPGCGANNMVGLEEAAAAGSN